MVASGNTLARPLAIATWYRVVSRADRRLRPAYSPKVFYSAGHPANRSACSARADPPLRLSSDGPGGYDTAFQRWEAFRIRSGWARTSG